MILIETELRRNRRWLLANYFVRIPILLTFAQNSLDVQPGT